jgi:hypothetical protein
MSLLLTLLVRTTFDKPQSLSALDKKKRKERKEARALGQVSFSLLQGVYESRRAFLNV